MSSEKSKLELFVSQCKPFDVLKVYSIDPFHNNNLQLHTCTTWKVNIEGIYHNNQIQNNIIIIVKDTSFPIILLR